MAMSRINQQKFQSVSCRVPLFTRLCTQPFIASRNDSAAAGTSPKKSDSAEVESAAGVAANWVFGRAASRAPRDSTWKSVISNGPAIHTSKPESNAATAAELEAVASCFQYGRRSVNVRPIRFNQLLQFRHKLQYDIWCTLSQLV